MFGFSFWEVFLVLVVALVVIGPERLPGVARKAGEWTYKVRKFVNNAKAELDSEFNLQDMKQVLNSQESEITKLRAMVEETQHDLSDTGNTVKSALDDAEQTMRNSASAEKSRHDQDETSSTEDKPADNAEAGQHDGRLKAVDEGDPDEFEDELSRLEAETGENFRRPFEPPENAAPTESDEATKPVTAKKDEPTERGRDN